MLTFSMVVNGPFAKRSKVADGEGSASLMEHGVRAGEMNR